jgi:urease accessory protein
MDRAKNANSQAVAGTSVLLQLLHLADSALPIGAAAHSFGIETLIAEAGLGVADLPFFFENLLDGQGHTEAAFCHWAHASNDEAEWHNLNAVISSFKPARESRDASLRLGKRFLALAKGLIDEPAMRLEFRGDVHLAAAFGRVGAALRIDASMVAAAYLHQSVFGAISACQRLLPFGQTAAMKLLWSLKPRIRQAALGASGLRPKDLSNIWNIQPLLEIASMRHPQLTTRLFIS